MTHTSYEINAINIRLSKLQNEHLENHREQMRLEERLHVLNEQHLQQECRYEIEYKGNIFLVTEEDADKTVTDIYWNGGYNEHTNGIPFRWDLHYRKQYMTLHLNDGHSITHFKIKVLNWVTYVAKVGLHDGIYAGPHDSKKYLPVYEVEIPNIFLDCVLSLDAYKYTTDSTMLDLDYIYYKICVQPNDKERGRGTKNTPGLIKNLHRGSGALSIPKEYNAHIAMGGIANDRRNELYVPCRIIKKIAGPNL
jgi:hypothetical protein